MAFYKDVGIGRNAPTASTLAVKSLADDERAASFERFSASATGNIVNFSRETGTVLSAVGPGGTYINRVSTLGNDATPSVVNGNLFITGRTITITDFDSGVVGQVIHILSAHAITITNNAAIILDGGADFVMADGDTLTLAMFNDQVWNEVARVDLDAATP